MRIKNRLARRVALAASVVAGAALVLTNPVGARAGTSTVTPAAIMTTSGSIGSGQSVANLAAKDLSGSMDDWNQYVEFVGPYAGYLTYVLPASLPPSSITGIAPQVNYRGPATSSQTWTFSLFDWSSGSWVPVGTNAAAPDWGNWELLTFHGPGNVSNYMSSTGELALRLVTNNGSDAADIDYAAIGLTTVAPADSEAPAVPANLAVTATTSSSVSLSWSASTDNVGVTGYEVFSGSTLVATVTATSATVSDLSAATAYPFTVKARDRTGNRSPASTALSVTTPAGRGGGGLPAPVACPDCWHPPVRTSWNWVISEVPRAPYRDVQMYDIDGFEATANDVNALHNAGKRVVCYLSAGSYENWRPDADQFPTAILGRNMQGWSGERWLDISDVRQPGSALARIMSARLDMCQRKGFDAVEFDNIEGYNNATGLTLTAGDQAFYNAFLANGAHSRGMSAVMKNDVEQITELLPYFDAALNESCHVFDECLGYSQFVRAGKPVFNAEYGSSADFCAADNAANINGVRFALDLDDSVFQPCR